MDDIENIIKRYKQELLEFSSQSKNNLPEVIPTILMGSKELKTEIAEKTTQPETQYDLSSTDIPKYLNYEEFLKTNTEKGSLRVQVFGGNQSFPITGARVTVVLPLSDGNKMQQFDGLTDINGVADNISLPAPPLSLSQSPENASTRPFAFYEVIVEHPQYATSRFVNVPVFPNVKSVQNVQLVPLVDTGEIPEASVQLQTEPFIKLRGTTENVNTNRS